MAVKLNHVQVAIPPHQESQARAFYSDLLGLTEVPKPPELAGRGGVWYAEGLHLGVEADFRPARKAHPAFEVPDLPGLTERLQAAGFPVTHDGPRFYVSDPFGNRVELMPSS